MTDEAQGQVLWSDERLYKTAQDIASFDADFVFGQAEYQLRKMRNDYEATIATLTEENKLLRDTQDLMESNMDVMAARVRELEAELAQQRQAAQEWVPVEDGEYPMVENAEMDSDFLYVAGNTDPEVCTCIEWDNETIMLDLGIKICRRTPTPAPTHTKGESE